MTKRDWLALAILVLIVVSVGVGWLLVRFGGYRIIERRNSFGHISSCLRFTKSAEYGCGLVGGKLGYHSDHPGEWSSSYFGCVKPGIPSDVGDLCHSDSSCKGECDFREEFDGYRCGYYKPYFTYDVPSDITAVCEKDFASNRIGSRGMTRIMDIGPKIVDCLDETRDRLECVLVDGDETVPVSALIGFNHVEGHKYRIEVGVSYWEDDEGGKVERLELIRVISDEDIGLPGPESCVEEADSYRKDRCLSSYRLSYAYPEECDGIEDEVLFGFCLDAVSRHGRSVLESRATSVADCLNLGPDTKTDFSRGRCLVRVAEETADVTVCEKYLVNTQHYDDCMLAVETSAAFSGLDEFIQEVCSKQEGDKEVGKCLLGYFTEDNPNPMLCDAIRNDSIRDDCDVEAANILGDESHCEDIFRRRGTSLKYYRCIVLLAVRGNYELCDNLEQGSRRRSECWYQVAIETRDKDYCEKMGAGTDKYDDCLGIE